MSRTPHRQSDPGILAVLTRGGESWSGMIVNSRSTPPLVVETKSFRAGGTSELNAWVEQHHVAETLIVLPAGAAICRTCSLPAAEPDQLEQALRLQAEAHLLGTAPPHRTGMAVLAEGRGETSRTGIVLAWPEAAMADIPPLESPVSIVPPAAALAALIDGDRPTQPLVWIDRAEGSVAIAITHANGAVFRSTREDMGSVSTWQASLGRVITETALSVGHSPEFIGSIVDWTQRSLASVPAGGSALLLPEQTIEQNIIRVEGAPREPEWWSTFGLAVGSVLARVGPLAALTTLQVDLPQEKPTLVRRVSEKLSSPQTAVRAVIAAVIILALGPMVFHGLRLQTLRMRHDSISTQLTAIENARNLRAMYTELEAHRWTMTKLLADLACSTPEGVDLTRVQINHGDSISIVGEVNPDSKKNLDARDVAASMVAMLQDSGVFTDLSFQLGDRSRLGTYEFSLSAKLGKPHKRVRYSEEQDFGKTPLKVRRYGPRPGYLDADTAVTTEIDLTPTAEPAQVETAIVAADPEPDEPDRAPTRTITRRGGGQDNTRSRSGGDSSSQARSIEQEIPEPLTEAQVDAMTRAERIRMMGTIAKARTHAKTTGNAELEQRLNRDWDLLKESIGRQ